MPQWHAQGSQQPAANHAESAIDYPAPHTAHLHPLRAMSARIFGTAGMSTHMSKAAGWR